MRTVTVIPTPAGSLTAGSVTTGDPTAAATPATGVTLSAVGLGTWQFGSRDWRYGARYAEETAPAIVHRCLDLGVTLFDTAEAYAMGRSERILGAALAGRRDDAFVATKLLPIAPFPPVVERRARASAARLGIEHIDLYQLHWPNPVVPLSVTMPALAALQRQGLVRHVGVSNCTLAQWQAAEAALGAPVLSNQVRYSLVDRRAERQLLPWAAEHDRLVIAYSPLGQGLLSGRYQPGEVPNGTRRNNPLFLPENLERARPLLSALASVAAAHDATPPQVALAWVLRRPNVVVIPGASSVDQAEGNIAAADVELTEDEYQELTAASDAFHPVRGLPAIRQLAGQRRAQIEERLRTAKAGLRA